MVLTAGATYKLLFIKHLTEIRVVVFATLKIPNTLMHNQLRGAQRKKSRQELNLSGFVIDRTKT